jgi:predicted nucleic acid-binding protein
MDLIADTSFLIGIWRNQKWAEDFAEQNDSQIFGIPWIALGEFWQGAIRSNHNSEEVEAFLSLGFPIWNTEPVVSVYAKISARLQEKKLSGGIGQNDLWIAATAIAFDKPLVTRNRRHFDKIEGLKLEALTE